MRERASHLDSVLDFTSVVSDNEGGLHDSRELDVAVSFMLTLELVQQGLIGSLGETRGNRDFIRPRFKTQINEKEKLTLWINLWLHTNRGIFLWKTLFLQQPFVSLPSISFFKITRQCHSSTWSHAFLKIWENKQYLEFLSSNPRGLKLWQM